MGRHSAPQAGVYGDTSYDTGGDALGEPDHQAYQGYQGYQDQQSRQQYESYPAYDGYGAYGQQYLQVDQHGQYAAYAQPQQACTYPAYDPLTDPLTDPLVYEPQPVLEPWIPPEPEPEPWRTFAAPQPVRLDPAGDLPAEPEPIRPVRDEPRRPPGRAATRRAAAPRRGKNRTAFAAGGVVVTGAVLAGAVVMHMPGGGSSAQAEEQQGMQSGTRANDVAPGPSALPMPTPAATGTMTDRLKLKYDLAPDLTLSGQFSVVPGNQPAPGKGKLYTYRVEIEDGLPLDGELFAQTVQATLNDPRSWGHGGTKTYARTDGPTADFVIRLASPGTTGKLCMMSGLDVREENVSCDSAATPWVVINAYRWAQGASTYGDDMYDYRHMLINHEVGHRMGHNHEYCTAQGALAPVMMQQTKTLTTGQFTCLPNPWPFPDGRPPDAPEQT